MNPKLTEAITFLQQWSNDQKHIEIAFSSYNTAKINWELDNPEESSQFHETGITAKFNSQYLEFQTDLEIEDHNTFNCIVKLDLFTKDTEELLDNDLKSIGNYLAVFNLEGVMIDDFLIME